MILASYLLTFCIVIAGDKHFWSFTIKKQCFENVILHISINVLLYLRFLCLFYIQMRRVIKLTFHFFSFNVVWGNVTLDRIRPHGWVFLMIMRWLNLLNYPNQTTLFWYSESVSCRWVLYPLEKTSELILFYFLKCITEQ